MIDHRIYQNTRAPDLVGAVKEGMALGDMVNKRKADAAIKGAYQKNVIQNPDGSTTLDRKGVLGDLYKVDPQKAMAQENEFKAQDQAAKDREFDMLGKKTMAAKQLAWSINDENSYQAAREQAVKMGLMAPDQLPPNYDPQLVEGFKRSTLSAEAQIQDYWKKRNFDADQKHKASSLTEKRKDRESREKIAASRLENDKARAAQAKAEKEALAKKKSPVQAKQEGLYRLGVEAEQQFRQAVSNPKDYDPTQTGQVIDNSEWAPNWMKNDNAIAAQAAQANWVEAFLRDASGAAIPPSERMAYAKDFFPQPGDTPDVVDNKRKLRERKMENARIGAGGDAKGVKQASLTQSTGQRFKTSEIEWAD
jgi:hypothetical protein